MCLHTVDKETKEVTEGWKVFRITQQGLEALFYDFKFTPNKWIKDPETDPIPIYFDVSYPTGFHFYFDKKEAEENLKAFVPASHVTILHIKTRNITATGLQDTYKVGVTREIFIEEEQCA